jgi:thioredoxin-like negative regulator of GroEL
MPSADPRNANVVVVLFTIDGCEACEEFKPRFQRVAQQFAGQVPIYMLDANSNHPEVASLAQRLGVTNVPATYAMRKPRGLITVVGGVPDEQIAWLLGVAAREA